MSFVKESCLLLLVCVVVFEASSASDTEPCCSPDQMTGDVYIKKMKVNRFYVDHKRQMVLEEWGGQLGYKYILYDLAKKKRYRRLLNNNCRMDFSEGGDFLGDQCMISLTIFYKEIKDADGSTLVFYKYPNGAYNYDLVVTKDECVPRKLTQRLGRKQTVREYRNVVNTVEDESVFDKDISDCVEYP